MFNRILVPLDGSSLAERAIPHAEQFARIFGSTIVLLHVLDPTSYHENPNPVDPLSWQIRKTEADIYMHGVAVRLRKMLAESMPVPPGGSGPDEIKDRVEYAIREGKTAENIINFAHTENIDLLMISSHGSGGLSHWNISSVTQKVINLIYLPVIIIRSYNQPEMEEARVHYRRILLPIDSSRRAECALSAGISLASGGVPRDWTAEADFPIHPETVPTGSSLQSTLILAAVVKPPDLPIPEPYPTEIVELSEKLIQVRRQAVSNYLEEMKKRTSVDCVTLLVERDSVNSAIQEMADQDEEIDLVVLCAHGYTGQSSWPYGSVARNYIEHGTKTVLIIQDLQLSQVRPSAAAVAAERSGGR